MKHTNPTQAVTNVVVLLDRIEKETGGRKLITNLYPLAVLAARIRYFTDQNRPVDQPFQTFVSERFGAKELRLTGPVLEAIIGADLLDAAIMMAHHKLNSYAYAEWPSCIDDKQLDSAYLRICRFIQTESETLVHLNSKQQLKDSLSRPRFRV